MSEILDTFRKLGMSASYHYADDTGKERGEGRKDETEAMKLYHANPELKTEFKEIAKGFLWSLKINLSAAHRRG